MTDAADPPKADPETLVLRARPRKVVRFKRNLLIGAAALACVGIVAVTWLGLKRPEVKAVADQSSGYDPEKASDAQKPKPDQLQNLPKTYADVPAGVPQLGPPLPGDLGKPILEHQQAQLKEPSTSGSADQASTQSTHESGLFFGMNDRGSAAPLASNAVEAGLTDASLIIPTQPEAGLNLDPDKDQNAQGRKLDFAGQGSKADIYNSQGLQTPASPYQVMAGTIINASLITGLKSDLPGMTIAQVTANVYDTVTGRVLLIPQGSRLIGRYDSVVALGQSRALVIWQRLIMPDGSSLGLDNLPATDEAGYAGLSDKVDYHTWSLLKGVGLSSLLGIAGQTGPDTDSEVVKAIRESTRQSANQAGQRIVEKQLNVQPGLTVRPGWPLRVVVHKDLILKPYAS
ncbi:TrbI/VirB10 family protein [Asticcacaulis sp. SL142]|uniref:TrbI/VirB10 family protein n=1 Tax=Asticcacaulis sp. SL142 TaxID=2995155 RepID=UPI00226D39B0|nr:TrbI/VirB10 family protein [Asticcacaulis sp. SL142]WAC49734.1 TrbI/VirB10 family protein [Asticcacaulis sp. SL142]